MKSFPLKSEARQACLLLALLFNIVLEVSAKAIRHEKETKGIQIKKEEVKLPLFSDDMMLCIGNPKESIKQLLEIINKLGKGCIIQGFHTLAIHNPKMKLKHL